MSQRRAKPRCGLPGCVRPRAAKGALCDQCRATVDRNWAACRGIEPDMLHLAGVEHEGRALIPGRCPYCSAVVLLDPEKRTALHQQPTCTRFHEWATAGGCVLLDEPELLPGADPRAEA